MGTKVIRVVGKAAGQAIPGCAYPYQKDVRGEQMETAKKNIIKKFASLGVSENEIEWTENIETI